jgi:DNA-binding CsgD family transcriptional regulator
MLFGRDAECARIDAVIDGARERRSGSLVLRGEAGIGKTALIEYAVERAGGFRVLSALGVESEAELAFAGLQQLLRPVMDVVPTLPSPQSGALKTAFAIVEGPVPDRLNVSVATLSVLAAAADDQPLLCVVDDAHWLDQASAESLTFAARRLYAEGVVMLFAAREPESEGFPAAGIPELRLEGLAAVDARALLAVRTPDLVGRVADQLVERTRGNPLALLEIPGALSKQQRLARALLDEPLPVDVGIERAFLGRVEALSSEARHALLLVAAGDPGDADTLWRALASAGVDGDAIEGAEEAGLLLPGRLHFCHPLARSAVYQGARPHERRAAHAALAQATTEPARRAWHLAAAADHPDETVADALENAAAAAGRRGGVAAEARALQHAARLTPDPQTRARRLLQAALAAEAAGWLEYAEQAAGEAAELADDYALRARAVTRRSYLLFDRGEFDRAYSVAVDEADHLGPEDAASVLTGAARVLFHRLEIAKALATVEKAWELAGATAGTNGDLCQMFTWMRLLAGDVEGASALARASTGSVDPGSWLAIDFGTNLLYLEDYPASRQVLEGVVERLRQSDSPGLLTYALDQLAKLETRVGNLTRAFALELECLQMTEPLGSEVGLAACLLWLGFIEAMLGRPDSRPHAEAALALAERRGDVYNIVRSRAALGVGALARGDAAQAVDWLEPAATRVVEGGVANPNWFRLDADLIEALARLGRFSQSEWHLGRLEGQAEATGSAWGRAVAARCRAFLSADDVLVEAFEAALRLHDDDPSAFERARTELCYGERLRRAGQRRAAREQLRSALEKFDRIGAEPWAERVRIELRASGAHLQRRNPTDAERLTPQELQVALLVAEGLTTRDLAARLFLSPKTIEFHLTRIYRKLEIHSRAELIRRVVDGEGGRDLVLETSRVGSRQSPHRSLDG